MKKIKVVSLYKFVEIKDINSLKTKLLKKCNELGIHGTFVLASEGINTTVAGLCRAIDSLVEFLLSDRRFKGMECKYSYHEKIPFYRMKVKIKDQLIPIGFSDVDPTKKVGEYVKTNEWNELISDPEVFVVDVRNKYEIEVGTFKGSLNPQTDNFKEFPEFVEKNLDPVEHKKVAMFCTGGIRCEKATSYMINKGFKNVYQLKGGILKYLQEIDPEDSLWEGECFVFDNRTSLDNNLENGSFVQCSNCRHPVSIEESKTNKYVEGISCPRCHDSISPKRLSSLKERQKQIILAEQRNEVHIGMRLKGKSSRN